MSSDDRRAKWDQVRRQASSGFVGLSNRLVDSPAYAALTYAPALKVLVWFWQMAEYARQGKKKGQESPVGKIDKIVNNGEISFTYQVAAWRGLSSQQFSRALKELFRFGFIEISHLGRGIQGDYTKFALSTKWQKYGTPEWVEISFPENFYEGFRKRSEEKVTGENSPLPMVRTHRCGLAEFPSNGETSSLRTAPAAGPQRRVLTVSVDLARGTRSSDGLKKKEFEGQGSESAYARRNAAADCLWSDEILDHSPWAEGEPLTMDYGWGDEATP